MTPDTNLTTFASGAVRGTDAENVRFDLITPIGLRRLAETCAEGAKKYGDHNWQKGMPASVMLNHAIRHVYLWLQGDALVVLHIFSCFPRRTRY